MNTIKLLLLAAVAAAFTACENEAQLLDNQAWGGVITPFQSAF